MEERTITFFGAEERGIGYGQNNGNGCNRKGDAWGACSEETPLPTAPIPNYVCVGLLITMILIVFYYHENI